MSRLKKVQGKKKRDAEAAEVARKALMVEQGIDPSTGAPKLPDAVESFGAAEDEEEPRSTDLLSSKDEDVIF